MIIIKSNNEIEKIKKACSVWKKVREALIANTKEGVSLKELDELSHKITLENGCSSPFHQYNGFPGFNCISVNEVVIHGVATDYKLKMFDMVTFDIGVSYEGYICDAAFTVIIGDNPEAQKISDVCYKALYEGINMVKPNNRIGDISNAIEQFVKINGYHVIRDFGGHGCGRKLHEDPIILNYGQPNTGELLRENMIICIEPMILTDSNKYYIDKNDNWSVVSKNKKLTCHWEHMVLVTSEGYEILTE